jgi:hypothetical protein
MRRLAYALLCLGVLARARAAEICHYAGSTDYAGRLALTTTATLRSGTTSVDVAADFEATSMVFLHLHYLVEEISQWRGGAMQQVAMNTRYAVNGHVVRQHWDKFDRAGQAFLAERVQGKTLTDFTRKHPEFAAHWGRDDFGRPWLGDYDKAAAERRTDLDLTQAPAGVRAPLAFAFYWVRFLPPDVADIPVFLPGFKADKLADVPILGTKDAKGTLWRAKLHYDWFSDSPASTAAARVSADRRLQVFAFDVHGARGSARGTIHQEGCSGTP